jgi:hypothetical protein
MTTPLTTLRVRVVIYTQGANNLFIVSAVVVNQKGSFDWKSKGLFLFLIVKSDWKA